jgi:omega-hydroxy-beta-dihydromenaquinone-9 sulfotransferase
MPGRPFKLLPAFPWPHFMAFAPLDAWARVLGRGRAWASIGPRYWPRLGFALFTSALGTALTLPERVVLAPVMRFWRRRSGGRIDHPAVFVLGYYRSGTTHLHYLLSCDPGLLTPRWHQCLAPQGFVVSWAVLRWFFVPFLSSTRPQDDVAIGPEWPAEDDFAHCCWNASGTMPGRMVVPRHWEAYRGAHALGGVPAGELARFRWALWGFSWKLAVLAGRRRALLLKTPAHTARVGELARTFAGPDGRTRAKFVHLSRDPAAVVRSNVAMHARFEPYLLEDAVEPEEVRRRIVEEYDQTERLALEQAGALPPGSFARVRFQDLVADPMGELRRVYRELDLPWTAAFEQRASAYLASVSAYRTASEKPGGSARASEPCPPELAWMLPAFGHDRPAIARSAPADARLSGGAGRTGGTLEGVLAGVQAALWAVAAWLAVAYALGNRLDWMVWPVGVAIGMAVLNGAKRGGRGLGLFAAGLTLAVVLAVAFPATWISDYRTRSPVPWDHVWLSTRAGVLAWNNAFWVFLGAASAYRLAGRTQARPPGA